MDTLVAYVLLVDADTNQVLLVQNRENETWSLPGGLVEDGETLAVAAAREAYEETGLTVEVQDLLAVNERSAAKRSQRTLFLRFAGAC